MGDTIWQMGKLAHGEKNVSDSCFKDSPFWGTCSLAVQENQISGLGTMAKCDIFLRTPYFPYQVEISLVWLGETDRLIDGLTHPLIQTPKKIERKL